MTDNNYMRHFASLDYIGTELADWLLQIDYYFITDGETPPEYMRLFYVKDGKITEELQNIDFIIYGNADNCIHTDYCIYMPTWNNGIYEFNKHTGKLKNIISLDSWSCVSTIDDKYIFFRAEDCLQIYDRESGKVTKTDIYEGMYDGTAVKYNGEVLYYSEDSKYYCYDIATGETSELSQFGVAAANRDYPWDIIAGNSDIGKYHINTKYRTDKLVSMTVTVRESGTQRNYIFEEIAQNFLNDGCVRANLRDEAYGMLCFTIDTYTGTYLFLLDPERNTIQYFNADETDTFFLSAVADTLICYTDSGYYTVVPEIKYEKAELSDEKGLLTEDYAEQIDKLMSTTAYGHPFAALQDFNGDDFPEIVVIEHNGGQGLMPCKIYDAKTLEYMGEFEGFCRDGFTNFHETADGVVVYNYYEHSVHSRYEGYSLIENVDGIFTERIVSSEAGIFNACGAYNAGIVWENSAGYKGIRYEAEGYSVSTFGYDIHATEAGKFLVDFYNNCRQIENIFNKKVAELESFSVFYKPLLAIGDYDMDGKPEAFFQIGINKPLSFIDSKLNISEVELSDPSSDSYNSSSVYKLWNGIIVFQGMGNSEPCLIYTVNNGKPEEITELSGKGMMFDYSRFYNGCYELCDSEYDGPYHTWKPYIYYCDKDGWHEYGSIEISTDEFLNLYGDEAQEIFDRIAATETPVENSGSWEVRSILYRSDNTYIINYGWDIRNEHIVVKPGITENDRLIEYPDYGGVYATAFIPELAVYPDSTHPDFDF